MLSERTHCCRMISRCRVCHLLSVVTLRNGGGFRSSVFDTVLKRYLILFECVSLDVTLFRVQRRICLEVHTTDRLHRLHSGTGFKCKRVHLLV
jgi:hypothetical protein